jgi:hypothetical protein
LCNFVRARMCVCVCVCADNNFSEVISFHTNTEFYQYIYVKIQTSFKILYYFVLSLGMNFLCFLFLPIIFQFLSAFPTGAGETEIFFCDSLNPRVVGSSPMLGTTLVGTVLARSQSYGLCLRNTLICGALLRRDVSHTHTYKHTHKTHTGRTCFCCRCAHSLSLSHVYLNLSRISTGHGVYLIHKLVMFLGLWTYSYQSCYSLQPSTVISLYIIQSPNNKLPFSHDFPTPLSIHQLSLFLEHTRDETKIPILQKL